MKTAARCSILSSARARDRRTRRLIRYFSPSPGAREGKRRPGSFAPSDEEDAMDEDIEERKPRKSTRESRIRKGDARGAC